MRSYAELEKEYQALKRKVPKGAEAVKLFFIGGEFLKDNKMELIPLDSLQERAATALQNYPQEERQKFAEAIQAMSSTADALQRALEAMRNKGR